MLDLLPVITYMYDFGRLYCVQSVDQWTVQNISQLITFAAY